MKLSRARAIADECPCISRAGSAPIGMVRKTSDRCKRERADSVNDFSEAKSKLLPGTSCHTCTPVEPHIPPRIFLRERLIKDTPNPATNTESKASEKEVSKELP